MQIQSSTTHIHDWLMHMVHTPQAKMTQKNTAGKSSKRWGCSIRTEAEPLLISVLLQHVPNSLFFPGILLPFSSGRGSLLPLSAARHASGFSGACSGRPSGREIWQLIAGRPSAQLEPSRSMETPSFRFSIFCTTAAVRHVSQQSSKRLGRQPRFFSDDYERCCCWRACERACAYMCVYPTAVGTESSGSISAVFFFLSSCYLLLLCACTGITLL